MKDKICHPVLLSHWMYPNVFYCTAWFQEISIHKKNMKSNWIFWRVRGGVFKSKSFCGRGVVFSEWASWNFAQNFFCVMYVNYKHLTFAQFQDNLIRNSTIWPHWKIHLQNCSPAGRYGNTLVTNCQPSCTKNVLFILKQLQPKRFIELIPKTSWNVVI